MLRLTYIALAIPVALFLATWLTPALAIAAVLALAWSTRVLPSTQEDSRLPDANGLLLAAAVSLFWLCMSGAGGVGWQQFDWLKHNAVLAALIDHSWPVFFSPEQPLVYYLAYYLVPALAGKLAGWTAANIVLAVQTWFFYFLAALWVTKLAGSQRSWALLLFSLFSGLDPLGNWLLRGEWAHNVWWSGLQYSAPASLLMFVPQHVIIGWLGAAAIRACDRVGRPQLAALVWMISPCWSPFVTIGLAPFAAYSWLRWRGYRHHFGTQLAAGLAVLAPQAWYLEARSLALPPMTWSSVGMTLPTLLLFLLLEWGLFAVLLVVADRGRLARPFVWLSMLSLALIPMFTFRGYVDFVMRVSIPALFYLGLECVGAVVEGLRRRDLRAAALAIALLLGATHAWVLYRQSVTRLVIALPERSSVPALPELHRVTGRDDEKLYLGRRSTTFFEHLVHR